MDALCSSLLYYRYKYQFLTIYNSEFDLVLVIGLIAFDEGLEIKNDEET